MEEKENKLHDRFPFSLWFIRGTAGFSKYEWGIGVSLMFYCLDFGWNAHPRLGTRVQFGPLWIDADM